MINFKYYNSGALLIFIAILLVITQAGIELLTPIFNGFLSGKLKNNLATIADHLGVFGPSGFVSAIILIINKWGWKWQIRNWRIFGWLIELPDLNGRYIGYLHSDFNGGMTKKVALEIRQTASSIKVSSYFADVDSDIQTSCSNSITEEVVKGDDDFFKLNFLYTNEPGNLDQQLISHGGTMVCKYFPDIRTLRGDYYNKRLNKGTIEVKFTEDCCLGRFK